MDKLIYDEIKPGHDFYSLIKGSKIQRFWHENKFKEINKKITGKFLDVGCASGAFFLFNKNGIGLDPSLKQLKFAKKQFQKNNFINAKVEYLPFKNKTFDTIILVEVIEHIDKKYNKRILKELKRVARKKIIITTPNYISLWPFIELIWSKINPIDYSKEHVNKFTILKAKKIFKGCKIKSIYIISPFAAIISNKFANVLFKIEKKIFPFLGSILIIEIDLQ